MQSVDQDVDCVRELESLQPESRMPLPLLAWQSDRRPMMAWWSEYNQEAATGSLSVSAINESRAGKVVSIH
ncbi:hypothetical protein C1X27_09380 [Pseudomonas sp. MPR-AND1B]|nr:hypothetical protein C1X26_11920 [Pseudomonas sp. MPR-R3A]PMY98057.1 hypothetical protein C1X24_11200 [Pseudomonas sp. FW305-124]PMZ73247.1 hypothetical protein C1X25_08925 [Pseudomonas sp. GW247-3R2A]PNA92645.1 hypothetical protein C1X23_13710 [Pseudomonas sp. FW300-E2]PNB03197.1 hypothetical protein C1X27_09380 [Pseudomonas sp. MPR-AND1B]